MSAAEKKGIFRDINPDEDDPEITEVESVCMNCEEKGLTRLFLTRIPFFKEVIVSSFYCEHCSSKNSELMPAGRIQDKGVKYKVVVNKTKDLNRQVVQSNSATVTIPELDFENPPSKGVLTTIEGLIDRAIEGLGQDQVLRRIQHPEDAAKIDSFIEKLENLKKCESPFHLIVDDPTGNSFIENPYPLTIPKDQHQNAPNDDPQLTVINYRRNDSQNETLGLPFDDEKNDEAIFDAKDEVMSFPTNCPNCNAPCPTKMKMIDIPHFKEVMIMATNCDACGLKESEVKSGGGIEPKGKRITLNITDVSDMSRDVLKGEWCLVSIPELDFTTKMSSMPGKFTTLEGLIDDIISQVRRFNPLMFGDSSSEETKKKVDVFAEKFNKVKSGELLNVRIILDDPTGNSYLQNLYAPDPDPEMTVELYDRDDEQNEELGINDMKTENYEET